MKVAVVYTSEYIINLGGLEKLHPYDTRKYQRIHQQLIRDGLLASRDVFAPEPLDDSAILRVHTPEFLNNLQNPQTIAAWFEAPALSILSQDVLNRGVLLPFRYASAGTLLAARKALTCGIAVNLGGGFHHAHPDAGEGFCIFADMPIAIRALQAEKLIQKILIIDLDVHHGNGTVACLGGDDSVFTFSMHQGDIYPYPKPKSNLDIALEAGAADQTYLALLAEHLPLLFEQARPNIVFFQAGCDTLADDPLAELEMTEPGIVNRDALVIDACVQRQIPVVMTLGGGYSTNSWHAQYLSIQHLLETHGVFSKNPDIIK
jgi:histone deacetylase 11